MNAGQPVQSGPTPKSMAISFLVVLVLYFVVFYGIEHWRHREGPWELEFRTEPATEPSLVVRQPGLGVTEVRLRFPGERAEGSNIVPVAELVLDKPMKDLPFGRRLHEDLLTLPGVETIEWFGHVIELSPRVLRVNQTEYKWAKTLDLTFWPSNKLARPKVEEAPVQPVAR